MSFKRPCHRCGMPTRDALCADCGGRKRATGGTTTARGYGSDWQRVRLEILERDGWRCYLCGVGLTKLNATVDHIQRISLRPDLRLDPTNLAACCRPCNASKQ
jgi:5-methylcytosine-specific restriction protein A